MKILESVKSNTESAVDAINEAINYVGNIIAESDNEEYETINDKLIDLKYDLMTLSRK